MLLPETLMQKKDMTSILVNRLLKTKKTDKQRIANLSQQIHYAILANKKRRQNVIAA